MSKFKQTINMLKPAFSLAVFLLLIHTYIHVVDTYILVVDTYFHTCEQPCNICVACVEDMNMLKKK